MNPSSDNTVSSSKRSLALLRGRTAAQSVPSISFRFDVAGDNLTAFATDDDLDFSKSLAEDDCTVFAHESAPSSRGPVLDRRSSSLDTPATEAGNNSDGVSFATASVTSDEPPRLAATMVTSQGLSSSVLATSSTSTASSTRLFSRFSNFGKILEDRINVGLIRHEKPVKDRDQVNVDKGESITDAELCNSSTTLETNNRSCSEKESPLSKSASLSLSNSPSRRSSHMQDWTEEIRSEFSRSIPKLSELRHRKTHNKEFKSRSSFTLNSILGRDDGLPLDDFVPEEMDGLIEAGVEAEEGILLSSPDQVTVMSTTDTSQPSTPITSLPLEQRSNQSVPSDLNLHFDIPYSSLPSTSKSGYVGNVSFKDNIRSKMCSLNTIQLYNCPTNRFVILILVICFALPLPSFLSGFIFGVSFALGIVLFILKLFMPTLQPKRTEMQRPMLLEVSSHYDQCHYKGWLNELDGEYCRDTYHVSQTHSVFARLHGSKLQLDHPRRRVAKHSRHGEDLHSGGFVHHREYELRQAKVSLLPRNLPRRWLWSRKYPICVRLHTGRRHEGSVGVPGSDASSVSASCQGSPARSVGTDEPSIVSAVEAVATPSSQMTDPYNLRPGSDLKPNDIDDHSPWDTTAPVDLELDSFEQVTEAMCTERCLYLFARSDREKDDWFRRLIEASSVPVEPSEVMVNASPCSSQRGIGSPTGMPDKPTDAAHSSSSTVTDAASAADGEGSAGDDELAPSAEESTSSEAKDIANYSVYMAGLLCPSCPDAGEVAWFNAIAGRLLYDFLHNPYWANKVQERVQRKLSKVHVPAVVGELVVCAVQPGGAVPRLRSVGRPRHDARGLWCDFGVDYRGNFTMTIETKLDLMKLKRCEEDASVVYNIGSTGYPKLGFQCYTRSSFISDHPSTFAEDLDFETDTYDSVESSSEEEEGPSGAAEGLVAAPPGGSRRLRRLVDSVAGSRYFQQATEWRLVQKAMRGVSNTRIVLMVKVERLCGTLTINIPPQPSDRLWYGFKTPPELVMVAEPQLGDVTLNLPFLPEYIQRQLRTVFEKVFVLPNMDDLLVPIMSPLLPGQTKPQRQPWDTGATASSCSTAATITVTPAGLSSATIASRGSARPAAAGPAVTASVHTLEYD